MNFKRKPAVSQVCRNGSWMYAVVCFGSGRVNMRLVLPQNCNLVNCWVCFWVLNYLAALICTVACLDSFSISYLVGCLFRFWSSSITRCEYPCDISSCPCFILCDSRSLHWSHVVTRKYWDLQTTNCVRVCVYVFVCVIMKTSAFWGLWKCTSVSVFIRLHGVTSQKSVIFTVIPVRNRNLSLRRNVFSNSRICPNENYLCTNMFVYILA